MVHHERVPAAKPDILEFDTCPPTICPVVEGED